MNYNVGDVVRIIGNNTSDEFVYLTVGDELIVINVNPDQEYPIELEDSPEAVKESEIELVRRVYGSDQTS